MSQEPSNILLKRAQALIEMGRYKEAIVELSAIQATDDGQSSMVLCHLAVCHFNLGKGRDALKYAQEAIAAEPNNEWAFRLMSFSYLRMGMNKEALKAAEEAAAIAPDWPLALFTLANAQRAYGQLGDAFKTATYLLEVAPDATAYNLMGHIYLDSERRADAEQYFRKALEFDPEHAGAHNNLGLVYEYSRPGDAREAFLTALKIDPTFEEAKYNLKELDTDPRFEDKTDLHHFQRLHVFYFFFAVASARIINGFMPDIVNLFARYESPNFRNGINIIFAMYWVPTVISLFKSSGRVDRIVGTLGSSYLRMGAFTFTQWLIQTALAIIYLIYDFRVEDDAGLYLAIVATTVTLEVLVYLAFTRLGAPPLAGDG